MVQQDPFVRSKLDLYGVHVEFIGSLYEVYGETRFCDCSEKSHVTLTTLMIVNIQFTTSYSTIMFYYVNGIDLVASCQKLKSKISSKDSKFQTE